MNKEREITAKDIADYLINYSQAHGIEITPFELQKYLYYAQGWHLAVSNNVLFDEKFEAWAHGPVIRKIYGSFKKFEANNIDEEVTPPNIPIDLIAFLKKFVIDKYFNVGSGRLWQMVHDEEAYKIARGDLDKDERSNNKLDESIMHECFTKRYDEKTSDERDEIDEETLEEIRESLDAFKRGETESYKEVFGHAQPGF